jgi:hypothetical protein
MMLDQVLKFLRNELNAYFGMVSGKQPGEVEEAKVEFVDGDKMEPIVFKLDAVSLLLVNIEAETTLRAPDPYTQVTTGGVVQRGQPDIRLNLYILFVACFKQYEQGLSYLSLIIKFFQSRRILDHQNSPELSDTIDHLVIELVTLPFSEQNEVWNALRTTYHPSLIYKVKMLVFRDEEAVSIPSTGEQVRRLGDLS